MVWPPVLQCVCLSGWKFALSLHLAAHTGLLPGVVLLPSAVFPTQTHVPGAGPSTLGTSPSHSSSWCSGGEQRSAIPLLVHSKTQYLIAFPDKLDLGQFRV